MIGTVNWVLNRNIGTLSIFNTFLHIYIAVSTN